MSALFRRAAFGSWVQGFVERSNAASGISRPPSDGEVAAHRGIFARAALGPENLRMFHAHACDGGRYDEDGFDPSKAEALRALLSSGGTPEELHDGFLALRPFADGSGRCARAVRMWARLATGHVPAEDGAGD